MRPDPFTNNAFLNSITEKIEQLTPPGLVHLKDEIAEVVKSVIRDALSKMNVVTREEFDIQSEVLSRTRAKLEQLEQRVQLLEQAITKQQGD